MANPQICCGDKPGWSTTLIFLINDVGLKAAAAGHKVAFTFLSAPSVILKSAQFEGERRAGQTLQD